jgi:hypothetical protein
MIEGKKETRRMIDVRNEVETCGRVICRMKEGSNEYKIFLPGPQILPTLHRVSLSAAHIT